MPGAAERMQGVLAAALALLLLAPAASAQDALATASSDVVIVGGEPGIVRVSIGDVDLVDAASVGQAIALDLTTPVNVSVSMSPPEGVTWEVLGMQVGLVVSGPGSPPPSALSRLVEARNLIPPGYTVVLNRTLDLSGIKALGAGVFLMQASLVQADGSTLYAQSFYVRVLGNPFFTAAGALVTAMSVATGYGLWRLFSDVRELVDTYRRHRRERRLRLEARDKGLVAKAKGTLREKEKLERRGVLRWTLTGIGLGAVALSWAQFLGYVAFDSVAVVLTALETGALFLGGAILLVALRRRLARTLPEDARTLVIQEGSAHPPEAAQAPPADAPADAPEIRTR